MISHHLMVEPEIEVFKVWPTQYDRELFIDLMTLSRKELRSKYPDYFYATRDRISACNAPVGLV